jgi:hypothetical protein
MRQINEIMKMDDFSESELQEFSSFLQSDMEKEKEKYNVPFE